ncbi:MAG TPA: hypothetical protein VJY62_23065, partial [Bacteroidia bacterium]|nr:hypothetical protein [Bacteroidia bacterium]
MLRSIQIKEIYFYSVCCIAFFIPLFPKLLPFLIGLSAVIFISTTNLKSLVGKLFSLKIPFLFIGFYLFYLIGLLYSENLKYGWNDVGTKVSLLIFPVILTDSRIYSENKIRIIFNSFIAGS